MRTSPSHARPPVVMGEPSLVPFTPRLLQLLQRRRPPPLSPSAAVGLVDPPLRLSLPSALLFIDVSGFTSLTESMSQKGASGLEQLTVTLNGFFALILHCIGGHRGDLLKVAGDALIVAFYDEDAADAAATRLFSPSHTASCSSSPSASSADASSTDGGLPLLTLRALRAALSLQSTVVCDGSLPLRLHIGATCGLTHYIVVGGEEQLWAVGGLTADIEAADTEATPIPPSSLPPPLPDLGLSAPATTEPLSPSTCSTASSVFSTFSPPSIPTSVAPHPIEPPSPTSPPRLTTADSPDQSLLSRARPRPLVLPRPPSDPSLFVVHRAGGSRWEFLAVGPAFDDLTTTVSDSKTGEVVCSGQLWARVSEVADVKGSQLDNGTGNWKVSACEPRHGAPLGKPEDEEAAAEGGVGPRSQPVVVSSHLQSPLVSFAMPALLSRLHTGLSSQSLWLGEYRRVTVLFISLPNPLHCQPPPPSTQSPPDSLPTDVQAAFHESKESGTASSQSSDRASPALPVLSPTASDSSSSSLASSSSSSAASSSIAVPSWLESFHQVVRTMQRAVFTLGGQVRQLLVDDKGCALIVAFGLPPLAQEDDAARALMAALDLLSAVHAQHPQVADSVSIGATTGRAWCGAVGSDRRKEYALVGDIVNLSARIMGNAVTRRRVMCDEETMRACGGRVRFSSNSRQVLVKGRVGLVMLYEPLGKARLSSSQPATAPQSRTDSPKTAQSSPVSSLFDRSIRRSLSSKSTSSAIVAHSPSTPGADWSRAFASPPLDESRALHSRDVALSRIASILVQSVGSVNGDDAAAEVDAQPADSSAAVAPVVVLEGGAGQGKTYLTARVAEQCRAAGMVVLIGTADSIEANSPFFAIALVLQDVVRLELTRLQRLQEEADEAKEVFSAPAVSAHSALLSLLPEADRRYVSLLYPLLPDCDEAERAPLLAVEVSMRPVLTRRLMRSLLLSHCQRHPSTVVLIEDAHWVDLQGWTLLRELTELIPTFRLMVTCRPIPAPDVISPASLSSPSASLWTMYAAVTEHPRCHHLVLAGLDLRTTTDLAIAFLGCRVLHPALASTIHQRSDGVPLFIQHLCSYLSEAHLVTVSSSGIARLDELQLANVTLPSSLEGLLASALDRLHPDCQLTLKVASVVGRHFSLSLVAACHPLAVDHAWLQSMMALAEQQRIVEKQTKAEADRGQLQSQRPYTGGEEGEEEEEESDEELRDAHYRFTHQLVRDAAYSSLLYQQRRDLHAQVADHLRLLSEADSGQDAHLSSPFSKPQTSTSGVRSASAQLLSHHYWLSVCVSGNVVAEKPDQRLLQCAVEYLLQTASGSRQLGAMDAVGLLLCLAARGLRRLQDEDRRDVLQVRWLYLVLGSEILYNLPLVQMLAIELGDASSAEGAGTHAVGSRCLRAFAHRMLSALAAKAVLKNLDPMQLQDHRFIGLYSVWYASLSLGSSVALPAFEALRALASTAIGPDAGYYQLEALCAAFSSYAQAHDSDGSFRSFTQLEAHPFYLSMLRGETKLTRFTLGYSPMCRLMSSQVVFQWDTGRVSASQATLARIMPMLLATEHAPSIGQGWTQVMRVSMMLNCCPLTMQLLQQAAAAFPAQDSTATHVLHTFRQCCLMTTRVWGHRSGEVVEYEADLLSLIALLSEQGDSFGMMFYLIVHFFPSVIDFRPEVPTRVHEAMLALMLKYHRIFSYNAWDIEIERFRAEVLIRHLQSGSSDAQDGSDRQRRIDEADRLLTEAAKRVRFERMLSLKLQMTWAALARMTGRVDEATARLTAALSNIPEAADTQSFHVNRAQQLLRDLDAARTGRREEEAE